MVEPRFIRNLIYIISFSIIFILIRSVLAPSILSRLSMFWLIFIMLIQELNDVKFIKISKLGVLFFLHGLAAVKYM